LDRTCSGTDIPAPASTAPVPAVPLATVWRAPELSGMAVTSAAY
jgi:hypothetical protein